jgi:hypothetical protein
MEATHSNNLFNEKLVVMNHYSNLFIEKPIQGISTLSPPKIIVTSIIFLKFVFFGNVWTSHLGLLLFVLSIFD